MEVIKTEIEGVVIIEPRIFKDARGYFFESYSQREFNEKVAQIDFCQDIWSNARSALSASAIHAKQTGAMRKRCCARCGCRHTQRVAYIRQARSRRTDRGQPPAVFRATGFCPRLCRAERCGCIPIQMRQLLSPRSRRGNIHSRRLIRHRLAHTYRQGDTQREGYKARYAERLQLAVQH